MKVAKHDGIRGLQKGLSAALGFQFTINFFRFDLTIKMKRKPNTYRFTSIRLGIFDSATGLGWTKAKNGNESVLRSLFWG